MTIQKSMTVAKAIQRMSSGSLLLPGIQRSFVWKQVDICRLFDSILSEYPIGSLLLWRVTPQGTAHFGFRPFHNHVSPDEVPTKHAVLTPGKQVTAVLDGQQRLTALYVGLAGSYRLRGTQRRLYLDLDGENRDATADDLRYGFCFLTPHDAHLRPNAIAVHDIRLLTTATKVDDYCRRQKLTVARTAVVRKLQRCIHNQGVLVVQDEVTGELDKILGIFARINRGAKKLSSAELLLSVATATWHRDQIGNAFSRLEDFRKDLNQIGEGFQFNVERLVKAGLVLIGEKEPHFQATTFRTSVGKHLEREWSDIEKAITIAVELLASFGLSDRSLAADNAMIPLASYAYHRNMNASYVKSHSVQAFRDREHVKAFVARTLLLPAYWTGAVDPVLVACNEVFEERAKRGELTTFPLQDLEYSLDQLKTKSIKVSDDRIEDLLDVTYGKPQAFLILRLLYPHMQQEDKLHKDHVFPRFAFETERGRRKFNLSAAYAARCEAKMDRLPNLQLLEEVHNNSDKRIELPTIWLAGVRPVSHQKQYRDQDLTPLLGIDKFNEFYDRRRRAMHDRLARLLFV